MKKGLLILFLFFCLFALVGCNSKKTIEYRTNLQNVTDKMLENASEVEEMLNKYSAVWSYSIESKGAIPVGEMATVTGLEQDVINEHFEINTIGNIPNDFSTNIYSLNSYYSETGKLEELENASTEIKDAIKDLNDPPEDYKKVYDEVLDMFTFTEEYIGMAINPDGSLQSFNENRATLSSDIINKYKRIEALMPSVD
ncbi:hypothetical protein U9M49_21415 [Cytobacillus sp. OWB-43]|uniref:hypothetical protein n=1 Tax=Cytobacillus sp. OWB-43 TaxID=3108468 RepID=UPI002AFE516F|nr:hypothetical protein [Cytobacillus sp. OWB-43]MEA1855625.1 hypothetical protein [Cytobacillus sp. OWB-43]